MVISIEPQFTLEIDGLFRTWEDLVSDSFANDNIKFDLPQDFKIPANSLVLLNCKRSLQKLKYCFMREVDLIESLRINVYVVAYMRGDDIVMNQVNDSSVKNKVIFMKAEFPNTSSAGSTKLAENPKEKMTGTKRRGGELPTASRGKKFKTESADESEPEKEKEK